MQGSKGACQIFRAQLSASKAQSLKCCAVLSFVYTKFFLTFFTIHKTNPLQEKAGTDDCPQEVITDSWLQQIKLWAVSDCTYFVSMQQWILFGPFWAPWTAASWLSSWQVLFSCYYSCVLLVIFLFSTCLLQVNLFGLDGNNNKNTNICIVVWLLSIIIE